MTILDEIADKTRERIASEKVRMPFASVREIAEAKAAEAASRNATRVTSEGVAAEAAIELPAFELALATPGFSFICEVKKASPSKGVIAEEFDPLAIAMEYEEAGADAISCLTEPCWFMGSDEYLDAITDQIDIPVLKKDFTVDEYMVYQAKAFGASAVLLICAILDDAQLEAYGQLASELGMSSLVEAHDTAELERALSSGARIVGVNNRNLHDFSVDVSNAGNLREMVPEDVVFVSESGVRTPDDVRSMAAYGADAALIGEALMRADDKGALLASMRRAAETARAQG